MDLTARYVSDSRRVITDIETADITNPDLPRPTIASLMVRVMETLRTMADHAERLAEANGRLRTENGELESQLQQLRNAADRTP